MTSTTIELPIAAAWMYMSDDQKYDTIPPEWSSINFKDVDVLNVGPAGVQPDGSFGLFNTTGTGDLANRFRWIIETARAQNPNIKIIVSQWWGDGGTIWGGALDSLGSDAAISAYTDSVAAFLRSYLGVAGGVDGYDIDYESNNVLSGIGTIISQIRTKLDALSNANGGRPFYVTVSPATAEHLGGAVSSLSFVNMQTYEGGSNLTVKNFTDLGLWPRQLLYGICPESGCTPSPTLSQATSAYSHNKLAGIHLWRLNSDNYGPEGAMQAQVYSFLHPR